MMKRWRSFQQSFQENILKKTEIIMEKDQKYDFKGQRIQSDAESRTPRITREQIDQFSRLDPPIQPQTREIRLKNAFFMATYIAWFTGIVLFIMYRLKSDDLDTMEKEAESRIKLRDDMKQMRQESSQKIKAAKKTSKEF